MKVFITGGSGFVGKRLVKKLLMEGHDVCAFARSRSSAEILSKLGCKTIIGDLLNPISYADSLKGQDVVIHAASPVSFWGEWSFFQQNIIDISKNLFNAAAEHKVPRFIYISSESVIQNDTPLENIDETFPYIEPNSFYGKAKQLTERWLLKQNGHMACIILRPAFIWGPNVSALNAMVEKVKKGQFIWLDNGEVIIESVHVDNVVHAIHLALTKGENKQVYYVTDDNPRSVKSIISDLLTTQNITPPTKNCPSKPIKYLASFVEFFWKQLHIKSTPPISRFEWSFVAVPRIYNIQKIKTALAYKPMMSTKAGLAEMAHNKQGEKHE
ncbi:MAG TPA: NAD(P)-dependent oxidoreductase [Gammaproteobacteria bacterium]|nr:NAD(P)-dependent oxidoreductase [Gammaproteobacteria bacterium]